MATTNFNPTIDVYVDTVNGACVNNDDLAMFTDPLHTAAIGRTLKIQLKFDLTSLAGKELTTAKLYMSAYSLPLPGPGGAFNRLVHAFKHNTPANISNTMNAAQANDFTYANILDTQFIYYDGAATESLPKWHCFDVSAGTTLGGANGYVVWIDRKVDGTDAIGYGMEMIYRSNSYATTGLRPYLEVVSADPNTWRPRARVL